MNHIKQNLSQNLKKWQRLLPAVALLALAACGQGTDPGGAGDGSGVSTADEDRVYQGSITVLQDTERDSAGLCAIVAESYPPQCDGLPVTGWDWDSVAHEEVSGVRWGTYIVTGTFDGKAFTLTEEALPIEEVDMADYPHLQYTEPEFGDPAEDLSAAELEAIATELADEFPRIVFGGFADEEHGAAVVDTLLVSPELEAYAAEHYPEDTVVFTSVLKPLT